MPCKLIFPGPYRKREKAFLNKHSDLRERVFIFSTFRDMQSDAPAGTTSQNYPLYSCHANFTGI